MAHVRRKFSMCRKGSARVRQDMRIALTKINKLYGIEPELKDASDEQRSLTARKRACRS